MSHICRILDGKEVAFHHLKTVKDRVESLIQHGVVPSLHVVLVGNNPASKLYTQNKTKKCRELGMSGSLSVLDETTDTDTLCELISKLNADTKVHGILVQLPLPSHINSQKVLQSIDPEKDVDGFHVVNVGKLHKMYKDVLIPCTAKGILEIIKYYEITTEGKNIVVVGRSDIVGRPVAALLSSKQNNATVTLCHSATKNVENFTRSADIVICALGKAEFLKADMIKGGAVVIDVGINRVKNSAYVEGDDKKKYKLVGDVSFESVSKKASALTPVPGGVGPMTIAMLMYNTVQAAINQTNPSSLS